MCIAPSALSLQSPILTSPLFHRQMTLSDKQICICFGEPLRDYVLVSQYDAVYRGHSGFPRGELVDRFGAQLLAPNF